MRSWPRSLTVQLMVSLLAVQTICILLAMILFPLLGPFTTYRAISNSASRALIVESLRQGSDRHWRLEPTAELAQYVRTRPHLRYAVREDDGRIVPGSAVELTPLLNRLGNLDGVREDSLRVGDPGARGGIVFVTINDHRAPGLTIAIAGNDFQLNDVAAFVKFFLPAVLPIYGPVLLGMLLVLPFVLGRVLRPVHGAATAAALINVKSLEQRLPTRGLPREFESLVLAINAALDRLSDGWQRQRLFTANAAHELRTPITVLRARIDILPAEAPARDLLMRDVRRLSVLVDQLLAIARLESNDVEKNPLDLVPLVRGVVADWAPVAIGANRELIFAAATSSVVVLGHARALEGAIAALIDNALKVTPSGTGVEVSVYPGATITVRDHGPGVKAEHRDLVFEPFWRAQETPHGFGLGLVTVRRTAQLHGGDIAIADAQCGGATFRFSVPELISGKGMQSAIGSSAAP